MANIPEIVTFEEYADLDFETNSGWRSKPDGTILDFVSQFDGTNSPNYATLHAHFFPNWIGHGPGYSDRLYQVDGPRTWKIQSLKYNMIDLYSGRFEVYDFDISSLPDSNDVRDLQEISPSNVPVFTDPDRQRQEGHVANPDVRARIIEYFQARQSDNVKKYIKLRKAPFEKSYSPWFGVYTYQGVANEALAKARMKEFGWYPMESRMFQPEDLAWLQTFMRNKEIEIPDIEELQGYRL